MKKADAIFTADIHLMDRQPRCRKDKYLDSMKKKLDFLSSLQEAHSCPVIDAGDLLDEAQSSPFIEGFAIDNLPKEFYTIFGNHDTPYRNDNLFKKSSLYILERSGAVNILEDNEYCVSGRRIKVIHELISEDGEMIHSKSASSILEKYPEYDVILTGDNHKAFVVKKDGKILVNPGSMMRMRADQFDFKPRCYLYYSSTNTVEPCYFPIEDGIVDRSYIDNQNKIDEKMNSFVKGMEDNKQLSLDFKRNVKIHLEQSDYDESVKNKVNQILLGENND